MHKTITATVVGLALAGSAGGVAVASSQPVSGHSAFCAAWARFGDTPSLPNLVTVNHDARTAGRSSRAAFSRFEAVLLQGRGTAKVRRASDGVWRTCGH